jgi:peroxiredoxin Q/BCP
MGLKIGSQVPQFSLKDQNRNTFRNADLIGKKAMFINFYPKDDALGCTKEAYKFWDSYEDFIDMGAEVIDVSSDSQRTHRRFAEKYNLPFVLLADSAKRVRRLFKVENNLSILPEKETFVVDKKGEIVMVFNRINAVEHMRRASKILKATNK